jgi:beta-N-acetylhexosaminidase
MDARWGRRADYHSTHSRASAAASASHRPSQQHRSTRTYTAFLLLLNVLLVISACAPSQSLADATPQPSAPPPTYTPQAIPPHWTRARPLTLVDLADAYIAQMSLDDKLGQLFIPTFLCCGYTNATAAMVEQLHVGGAILYAANVSDAARTRSMTASAQAHSPIPMLITLDEEGGGVDRLRAVYGPHPSARTIALSHSTSYAQDQGARTAREMAALGINVNLAPDVDVQLVAGPDLGSRNFGTDAQTVITYAGAYLTGLQNNGVLGTLKHFPGLGASTIDAHEGLPVINRSRDQIESVELAPYRNLIATGQVGAVMTTDLLMPAIDTNLPAELSPKIINGILRDELGFDGVVITDALYMQGISDRYSMPEAGVLAILAGCDMMEGPMSPSQVMAMEDALRAAIQSGRLTKDRIDQSVRRILILKMRMGLIPIPLSQMVPITPIGSLKPVAGPPPASISGQ